MMIAINNSQVDALTKTLNSKSTKGKDDTTMYPIYANSIMNFLDVTREFCTYEMAHWVNNNDRWIRNRSSKNTVGYKRGTLLFVDLGAVNYRFEPSFTHPCIVLAETRDFILVVPCSSKKYGEGYPEIIDATPADGFSCNTGVQTKSFRWISKNRVISKLGTVSSAVLDQIDEKMLALIPTYAKIVFQKDCDIKQLQSDLAIVEEARDMLQKEWDNCRQELELVKISLRQAEERIEELENGNN